MATLDVSDAFDDDLCDTFEVRRRVQTVNNFGEVVTSVEYYYGVFGAVQPKDSAIGGNEIEREPDMQYRGAALDIHTMFRLRGPSLVGDVQYQPDVVMWNGDPYLVTLVNDYAQFGAGYTQAELASMASVDAPPPEAAEVDENE